ncbi:unnamed protein product [Pylaiella littoralis]
MASTAQPRTSLAIATAFLAGATYILWQRSRSTEDGEEEEWEPVDRDHVVKFFQLINQQSHQNIAGFNQQIAQYRGKVPDQHLTDLAIGHFEDQLAKSQEQILSGMGISLEDMEDASKYYEAEGDSQVQDQMKLLVHLYKSVAGLPIEEPELPDDLTAETMVMVVTAFWKASNNVIKTVVQDVLDRGGNLADETTNMSMSIQKKSGPATDEAIKRFNLDSTTVGPAIEKFREHPEIRKAMMLGSEEQHSLLRSYGLV